MSGILANSATVAMLAGASAADNTTTGFLEGEEITLSVTGTPTTIQWALARPTAAGTRSALSDTDALSVSFTPRAAGYYVASCVIDGVTTYVLRIGVASLGAISTLSAVRFMPIANAQVPTPPAGRTVYFSTDANALVEKRPDGSVHVLTVS